MSKKKYIILGIVVLVLLGLFKIYTVTNVSDNLTSLDLIKSILKFEKNNDYIYKIQDNPLSYMASENDEFIKYMKKNKFDLVDQLGSILIFENKNNQITFKASQVTKKYILFEEIKNRGEV